MGSPNAATAMDLSAVSPMAVLFAMGLKKRTNWEISFFPLPLSGATELQMIICR
jgi:hypothetical protein